MLLTALPFDHSTLLEIGDRRRPPSATGTRVRRDAGRGKIR